MRFNPRRRQPASQGFFSKSRLGLESLERRDCPAALLGMQVDQSVVLEGERVEVTLTLSERMSTTERVIVTTKGLSATYGLDYFCPLSQQVTFAPGQMTQKIFIHTLQEAPRNATEGTEYFRITATPVTPALGARAATVGIADYVTPPSITFANASVTEGNSGTSAMAFSVSLSASYPKPVTVSFATRDGSATTANADYVATSGTLVFSPGETTRNIEVTINGDRFLEPDETFSLVLSAPQNGTLAKATGLGTIRNDEIDQPGFQFVLTFQDGPGGPVPQSVRNAATQAAARWSRIITGDVPGVTQNGLFVDDFNMVVQMGLLGGAPEGPGGVLANARPTDFRDGGNGLPYAGITGIDPNDINAGSSFLIDVLAHEMGHALGFTRNANVFSRFVVGDTFTGPNAVREFNSVFSRTDTSVPLQLGGGHWDETVFGNELMTPFVDGTNRVSRVTVGALADMGYTVNYAAAETYSPPLTAIPPVVTRTAPAPTPAPVTRTAAGGVRGSGVVASASRASPVRTSVTAMAIERAREASERNGTRLSPKPFATAPNAGKISDSFRALGRQS